METPPDMDALYRAQNEREAAFSRLICDWSLYLLWGLIVVIAVALAADRLRIW